MALSVVPTQGPAVTVHRLASPESTPALILPGRPTTAPTTTRRLTAILVAAQVEATPYRECRSISLELEALAVRPAPIRQAGPTVPAALVAPIVPAAPAALLALLALAEDASSLILLFFQTEC